MTQDVYLKIKNTTIKDAVSNLNNAFINIKLGTRVSNDKLAYAEKIPYNGIFPLQEYMYTFKAQIDSDINIVELARNLAPYGIGLTCESENQRSVIANLGPKAISNAINALVSKNLDERSAKETLCKICAILLPDENIEQELVKE